MDMIDDPPKIGDRQAKHAPAKSNGMWRFEPVFNLGHILVLSGLLGGGVTVYVGLIQVQTNQGTRIESLEKSALPKAEAAHDLAEQDHVALTNLSAIADNIRMANTAILDQLTGIRVDVGVLKARIAVAETVTGKPP